MDIDIALLTIFSVSITSLITFSILYFNKLHKEYSCLEDKLKRNLKQEEKPNLSDCNDGDGVNFPSSYKPNRSNFPTTTEYSNGSNSNIKDAIQRAQKNLIGETNHQDARSSQELLYHQFQPYSDQTGNQNLKKTPSVTQNQSITTFRESRLLEEMEKVTRQLTAQRADIECYKEFEKSLRYLYYDHMEQLIRAKIHLSEMDTTGCGDDVKVGRRVIIEYVEECQEKLQEKATFR